MYKVTIDISEDSLIGPAVEFGESVIIEKIIETLEKPAFINFFAKKCEEALKKIAVQQLSTVNTNEDIENSAYMNGMRVAIKGQVIELYNNSQININEKNMSDEAKARYTSPQLSLAQIVEYGIGYTGSHSGNKEFVPAEWEYDVNKHGVKGWYYKDENGKVFWTNGFEGRFVFLKLAYWARDNASEIIHEYLKKNMKD